MKKKLMSIIACGLAAAMVLTGCGNSGADTSGETDSKAEVSEESSEETTESKPASEEEFVSVDDQPDEVIYEEEGTVYFAIPDGTISRWPNFDAPMVEKWLKVYAPNLELEVLDAEGDSQKQLQQIEGALNKGGDFIIYTAADMNQASGVLQLLNQEEMPFCALSHTPFGGECPIMVTMPFPAIAQSYIEYMEEEILPNADDVVKVACIWGAPGAPFYEQLKDTYHETFDKWVDEGKIEIVFEADTNDWTANSSAPVAEQMLTQTQNDVDVIVSQNDDLITGIVSALVQQDMVDDVQILGGCDATNEGLARVQEGWQAADVLPNYNIQAKAVAQIVAKWLRDGECPINMANGVEDNDTENGIPLVVVDPVMVTADNLKEECIDSGVTTQESIDAIANTLTQG